MRADRERFSDRAQWIETKDALGTGCTYSAALSAFLANRETAANAVVSAKYFMHAAIEDGLELVVARVQRITGHVGVTEIRQWKE